jgi:hypothetical protein
LKRPIILIGAGRSGTTVLGEILRVHPDVAFWSEPRPVWMYGHAYRGHHRLTRDDLSPRIARYIDRRFDAFRRAQGKSRFMEKTPSNCLRIPFIHALYPDCRIVNLIRDGAASVRSRVEIAGRVTNPGTLVGRLKETPVWEWPAYVPLFFNTVFRSDVLGKPARYWGEQPPGWRALVDLPPHLIAAHQWTALVSRSIEDGRALPSRNYLEIRFEDLLRESERTVSQVLEFAELSPSALVIAEARERMDPARARSWPKTLTPEEQAEALSVMKPLLLKLGYAVEGPS